MQTVSKQKKLSLAFIIIVVVAVVIDQIIKIWVKTNMQLGEVIPVFGHWFNLHFIENEGMAFGLSFGENFGKLLLSLIRVGVVSFIIDYIIRSIRREQIDMLATCVLSLIVAGAIGNIIDSAFYGMALGVGDPRFMYGSVVDMIYVRLFMLPEWFPGFGGEYFFPAIFNFADACVTVGIFAMIIFYKQFFKDEKKKEEPTSEETGSESSQPAEETPQQN